MNRQEFFALIDIVNRAPTSAGEKLFLQGVFNKLNSEIEREEQAQEQAEALSQELNEQQQAENEQAQQQAEIINARRHYAELSEL